MVSDLSVIRSEAEEAVRALVDCMPAIQAALLFGSVARGDAGQESDIDLLVVADDPLPGELIREKLHGHPRVSLVTHDWQSLRRAQDEDWSFFVHLSEEGEMLYGSPELREEVVSVRRPAADSWRSAVHRELETLSRFEDLSVFSGQFGFVLGHAFASARFACMLDNTAAGEIAFDRGAAFETFGERHPGLADEISCVHGAWPFHARANGRDIELPFSSDDADRAREVVAGARLIVASAAIDG